MSPPQHHLLHCTNRDDGRAVSDILLLWIY